MFSTTMGHWLTKTVVKSVSETHIFKNERICNLLNSIQTTKEFRDKILK